MNKVKKIAGSKWHIMLSFIAPAILLLVIYAIKGVYPFGNRSIAYYDMAQSYIPAYSYAWDVLHGLKSPYISFNAAMGCSMTDIMGFFVYFPTNLFLYFVPRTNLLGSMSYFLILKLMLISGFMSLYVSKRSENKLIVFLSGFAYATSGFVVQYYSNIYYLDSMILLPVLVHATEELLQRKKKILYIISIVLLMLTNPQMILPVGIYVILKVFFYCKRVEDKAERSKILIELIIYTAIGVMISAFSLIPSLISTTESSRFTKSQNSEFLSILLSSQTEFFNQKMFMLYGCEAAIAVIIALILAGRKTIRKYAESIVMIVILALPIVFENINLIWHGGSYQHFPMRFAYLLSFECILLVVSFMEDKEVGEYKFGFIAQLFGIAMIPLLSIVLWVFLRGFCAYGIRDVNVYNPYGVILIVTILFYLLAAVMPQNKIRRVCITAMILVQGSMALFAFVAPTDVYLPECDNELAVKAETLYENNSKKTDGGVFDRVKDRNISMITNYGFIADTPSIGGWMNGINSKLQAQMDRMGYSINYTRILDGGGTAFTDALLGAKRIYSEIALNLDDVYKKTDKENVYGCKHTLPQSFLIGEEPGDESTGFEYQNELFSCVTGMEEDLFESYLFTELKYDTVENNGSYQYTTTLDVTEPSVLYMYSEDSYEDGYAFAVNDEIISLPILTETDNQLYAQFFLNGMIEAGEYSEGPIEVSVITNFDAPYSIYVGLMKLSVLESGFDRINDSIDVKSYAGKRDVTIEYESQEGGNMFIPLEYSEGWNAEIDGKITSVKAVLDDSFMGINAPEGKHTVTLKYTPKGQNAGVIMTIVGALAFACVIVLDRKKKLDSIKAPAALWSIYALGVGAFFAFVYIIPILSSIIMLFINV